MIRYLTCAALLLLAMFFFKTAARLLFAAHRVAVGAKPVPVAAAEAEPMQERYDVTISVESILDRTLH